VRETDQKKAGSVNKEVYSKDMVMHSEIHKRLMIFREAGWWRNKHVSLVCFMRQKTPEMRSCNAVNVPHLPSSRRWNQYLLTYLLTLNRSICSAIHRELKSKLSCTKKPFYDRAISTICFSALCRRSESDLCVAAWVGGGR